jgi:hypothetical protein
MNHGRRTSTRFGQDDPIFAAALDCEVNATHRVGGWSAMEIDDIPAVPLSAAIEQVRTELERSMDQGKDSKIAFRATAEIEFEAAFEMVAGVDGGVRVWVISAGARGEARRTTTHRIKLTLTAVNREGGDALVRSEDEY